MKQPNFKKALAVSLMAAAFAPTAQAEDSPHTLSYNAGLASEYIYRGISQSNHQAAVSAGADYSHTSGFYASTWASNVRWHPDFNPGMSSKRVEWDVWGGYKGEIVKDVSYDVGALQYYYPGSMSRGVVNPNTTELYGAITYKWITAKYSQSVSNLFANPNSKGSTYFELNGDYEVSEGLHLIAHLGHQTIRNNSVGNYTDYQLGATKDWSGFKWGASFVGTNANAAFYTPSTGKNLGSKRLLVSVTKTF